jgi:hypothetical protein
MTHYFILYTINKPTQMSFDDKTQNITKGIKKPCMHCKKKTMILLSCKCGKLLCIKHINCDKHKCDYDHKADIVLNDAVLFDKMEKI